MDSAETTFIEALLPFRNIGFGVPCPQTFATNEELKSPSNTLKYELIY